MGDMGIGVARNRREYTRDVAPRGVFPRPRRRAPARHDYRFEPVTKRGRLEWLGAAIAIERSEWVMSKPPDEVDALLLRIRTMKWQAITILATSPNGLAREEAAADVATLDGIASSLRNVSDPGAIKAARDRVEALARLRDHEPLRRAAGRS
jgi:hypothetical protein